VLIVEDDRDFAASVADILESRGYTTSHAENAAAARASLDSFEPEIALIDVRLGEDTGIALLRELGEARPRLMCLIMTAYADVQTAVHALRHGAYDYLRKPVEPDELLASLDRCFERLDLQREREVAERELRVRNLELSRSEARYRKLVEDLPVGMFTTDVENQEVRTANPALVKMLGYGSADDVVGRSAAEFYVCEHERTAIWRALSNDGIVSRRRVTLKHRDGRGVDTLMTVVMIPDDEGRGRYFGGIIEDLTAQGDLERQLARAQRREAIAALAGGVAHDFRNLLQIVHGHAELMIMDTPEDHPTYADLREIKAAARRGAELTGQLLSINREEEFERYPVNLNHEIDRVYTLLRNTFPKSIDIRLDLEEGLPTIQSNRTQVERIILNLAVNAKDAMPDGGSLTIRTRSSGALDGRPEVTLEVADSGIGMAPDVLGMIFEPFFTTKSPSQGTGLGLTAVARIVEAHGGRITCDSHPDEGTTFTATIPCSPMEPADADATATQKVEGQGNGATILVVDDEDAIRRLLERSLSTWGYNVVVAPGVRCALDIYAERASDIDLAVLDLDMPDGGGYALLERLARDGASMKVVVASGTPEGRERAEQSPTKVAAYVSKPFALRDLAAVIRSALGA